MGFVFAIQFNAKNEQLVFFDWYKCCSMIGLLLLWCLFKYRFVVERMSV